MDQQSQSLLDAMCFGNSLVYDLVTQLDTLIGQFEEREAAIQQSGPYCPRFSF
jgi:hypothetical protein